MFNFNFIVFVSLFCLNGRGLGGPVTERKGILISDYLHELADGCPNSLLASELKKALENCSLKPPDKVDSANEKQLLCVMYFDINSQLCQGTFQETDFAGKYAQDVLVKDFCTESGNWTVSNVIWYPNYQTSLEGLLKDKFSCSSLCHDPSNLYKVNNVCKLYKVGYDLLHETKHKSSTEKLKKDVTTKKPDFAGSDENERPPVILRDTSPAEIVTRKELDKVYVQNSVPNPSALMENKLATEIIDAKIKNRIKLANKPHVNEPVQLLNTIKTQDVVHEPEVVNQPEIQAVGAEVVDDTKPNVPQDFVVDDTKPNVPQDILVDDTIPNVSQDIAKEKGVQNTNAVAQPSLKKDKVQQGDIDDWGEPDVNNDNELANEDPALTDDDADGTELEKSNKPETKPAKTPEKTPEHSHVAPKLPDSMQKVSMPIQPEYPSEDEDHFFSFFITIIVLVALLYVLYHNKSKVTKVVLGLIVEGRQSGRRRNSRGHAYKRLDTLEQAMSSNTTAPPSKIIY